MSAIQQLLTDHIDIWTAADTEKKSGRGRASGNAGSVYGIKKLRELILELAVRGKLVAQDVNDEPASELLKRIQAEKAKLIAEGKIKKDKPLAGIVEAEKPFDLPKGWEWVRLNELLSKIGAGSTPLGGKQVYVNEGIPFLRSQNVWDDGLRLDDVAFIMPETHQKMSGTHVYAGDLLFNITGASIGRCAIVPDSFKTGNVSQHVTIVRTSSKEILQFLHLVLISRHVQQTVMDVQVGVSREGLSIGKLGQFIIPIPPLTEQHSIVAKVDELMALCDQLETRHSNAAEAHEKLVSHLLGMLTQSLSAEDFSGNWQRIAAHFDTLFTTDSSIGSLKQTLLQLAVMGKLVPQDVNDEPACELLKLIQVEKAKLIAEGKIKKDKPLPPIAADEKSFYLPSGWSQIRFGEIIELVSGQHLNPSEYFESPKNDSIPYITGPADFGDKGPVPIRHTCERRAFAVCGDILVTVKGSGVGKTNTVSQAELAISRQLMSVRPIITDVNYIEKLLITLATRFQELTVGIAIPGISREDVLHAVIEIPPLAEQHRIVAKVDELMALCDQLKSRITDASQLRQKLADVMVEQAVA